MSSLTKTTFATQLPRRDMREYSHGSVVGIDGSRLTALVFKKHPLDDSRRMIKMRSGNPWGSSKRNGLSWGALRPFVGSRRQRGAGLHARTNTFSEPMALVTILRWCRCLANPCSSTGCAATGRPASVGCVAAPADTFGRRAALHAASHEAHRLHRAVRVRTVKGQIA
jgi:hypothetical protein